MPKQNDVQNTKHLLYNILFCCRVGRLFLFLGQKGQQPLARLPLYTILNNVNDILLLFFLGIL